MAARGALRTITIAHGPLTPDDFATTLDGLVEEGLVEARGDELRPADGLDRIPHPGEA